MNIREIALNDVRYKLHPCGKVVATDSEFTKEITVKIGKSWSLGLLYCNRYWHQPQLKRADVIIIDDLGE